MVDGGPALKSTPTKSIAGRTNDNLVAAVTQDLMCKPFILHKTGLTIEDHQKITVCRYARLLDITNVYVIPFYPIPHVTSAQSAVSLKSFSVFRQSAWFYSTPNFSFAGTKNEK